MPAALVDASAMIALFGANQPQQQRYTALFKQAAQERWYITTTWPCVTEAAHMLDPPQRYDFLSWIGQGAVVVFPFEQSQLLPMLELMQKYTTAPRSEMDLADASLYWLACDTQVNRIMTMDVKDFSRYRLPNGQGFEIL